MPQIATAQNSVILGKAGQDYNDAVVQGGKAMLASKISADVTDIHQQYPNDAQLFQTAVKAKAAQYQSQYPGQLGNSLADMTNSLGAAHYANIVETDINRSTKESLQAITTHIDDTNNQLRAMARQGAINTPEYDRLSDALNDSYDDLGSNKSFGYSQDKIDSERAHSSDMLNGEFVVGRVDDAFNRKGKAEAQAVIQREIADNPNLVLGDAERNQLKTMAFNRLDYLTAEQRANQQALRPRVDSTVKILEGGNQGADKQSDQDIDATIAQAHSLGDICQRGAASSRPRDGEPLDCFSRPLSGCQGAGLVRRGGCRCRWPRGFVHQRRVGRRPILRRQGVVASAGSRHRRQPRP